MQSCTCPLFINNINPVQGHTGLFWVAVKFESLNTPIFYVTQLDTQILNCVIVSLLLALLMINYSLTCLLTFMRNGILIFNFLPIMSHNSWLTIQVLLTISFLKNIDICLSNQFSSGYLDLKATNWNKWSFWYM